MVEDTPYYANIHDDGPRKSLSPKNVWNDHDFENGTIVTLLLYFAVSSYCGIDFTKVPLENAKSTKV